MRCVACRTCGGRDTRCPLPHRWYARVDFVRARLPEKQTRQVAMLAASFHVLLDLRMPPTFPFCKFTEAGDRLWRQRSTNGIAILRNPNSPPTSTCAHVDPRPLHREHFPRALSCQQNQPMPGRASARSLHPAPGRAHSRGLQSRDHRATASVALRVPAVSVPCTGLYSMP